MVVRSQRPHKDESDVAALGALVDPVTVARGVVYARSGAVLTASWDSDRSAAAGKVQGSAGEPYSVSIRVERDRNGKLTALTSACSCPVGFSCKHAVALLLHIPPSRPGLHLVGEAAPEDVDDRWIAPLQALLSPTDVEVGPATVGLQFDPAQRPVVVAGRRLTRPGLQLRPVVRSRSGNWVRSGISWSRLSAGYATSGSPEAARTALLEELRALAAVFGQRQWYGYPSETVWLDAINSRRVWDLLADLADAGVLLVVAGKAASAVRLLPAADAVVDASQGPSGLVLRPHLQAGGAEVDRDSTMLIGSPAHGMAWWAAQPGGGGDRCLHLAPFSRPLDQTLAGFLEHGPLRVPPGAVERFERTFLPALRRRVEVVSPDKTVVLPDSADTVIATVHHVEGPGIRLCWSLADAGGDRRGPDAGPDAAAAAALAAAAVALQSVGGLVGDDGRGLAPLSDACLVGMDAVRFLAETLPLIESIDGVEVEHLGEIPEYREATAAPVVHLGGSASEHADWFDLAVEVTVGGEAVPFAELFAALAAGESHLLLPSGTYFALDSDELRRLAELITEARSLTDRGPAEARLSRYQASLWDDLAQLGQLDGDAAAWSSSLAALLDGSVTAPAIPEGVVATLRPYQLEGFRWLADRYRCRLGGILADDMGLGKTLQVLALISHVHAGALRDSGGSEEPVPPFLVVAPTSVVPGWISEVVRFAPQLQAVAVTETERRRGVPLSDLAAGAQVVVTSYALFRIDQEAYQALPWAGLILDEAQFAKNPVSHANQGARRLRAPWKLALTGTPFENNLQELWALTAIAAPGLFPRPDRFAETYRTPIERHSDQERLDQLRRRLRPVMLRRTKQQVATDLPDKHEQILELELHPAHRKAYDTYLQRERQKVLGLLDDLDGNRFEIFRSLTLLRQASLDVALVDARRKAPSVKLDALVDMVQEAAADDHRVLVFSQFTRFLTAARTRIEDAGVATCYLDGKTRRRAEVLDRFRRGAAPAFLISLKAGGFGLNLTEADHCVLLDPWWNPATEAQAVDRIHRIGQAREVMVYRLVSKGTIEEKVMALKARKAALFASVIDGGGFETAALSSEDIRELLS
jgi:superfamily II DNA or RNA helicase